MTQSVNEIFSQITAFCKENPYIAAGVALIYLFSLIKRPKKTFSFTIFLSILLIVSLWFWDMYQNRNNKKQWNPYQKERIKQID